MKSKLAAVTQLERDVWSRRIAEHVTTLSCYENARSILGFIAMPGEVNAPLILQQGLKDGKSIYVPRMYEGSIRFHRIENLEGPWEAHPFGVREPSSNLPTYGHIDIQNGQTLVITPGLAFDKARGRLGFGKGYYDGFIDLCRSRIHAKDPASIRFVGVCFLLQLIETVPAGETDCLLDGLVTENGVVYLRDSSD